MPDLLFHVFSDERFMDLTLYQFGYEKCRPLHSYGPFIRNNYLFHYVISGHGTLLTDDTHNHSKEYKIGPGSGFLIEPGRINSYYADREDPWEYTWIEFGGLRAKEILESSGLSSEEPVFCPISADDGERIKNELLYLSTHGQESSLHLIGHLYLILDAVQRGSSRKRTVQGGSLSKFYTKEAVTFIEQNYAFPITVEDMAGRCKLDRSYFGKIFRETMGQSPQEFLIRYRMSKAAELLKITDLSIGEISIRVGYPNQLHFSRAFKKVFCESPRAYRQNNKILKENR
ncbi:MAG: AraC family transcriptional regulator [Blautia sp.]|nr:AraC family transcriptional regulator [Blautia sp.]MDY3998131.1 AraC family transcriptional regulator [Blautia sp.]